MNKILYLVLGLTILVLLLVIASYYYFKPFTRQQAELKLQRYLAQTNGTTPYNKGQFVFTPLGSYEWMATYDHTTGTSKPLVLHISKFGVKQDTAAILGHLPKSSTNDAVMQDRYDSYVTNYYRTYIFPHAALIVYQLFWSDEKQQYYFQFSAEGALRKPVIYTDEHGIVIAETTTGLENSSEFRRLLQGIEVSSGITIYDDPPTNLPNSGEAINELNISLLSLIRNGYIDRGLGSSEADETVSSIVDSMKSIPNEQRSTLLRDMLRTMGITVQDSTNTY